MAYYSLRLACLAMLMLALHLEFSSAAVTVSNLKGSGLTGDAMGNKPDAYVKVWCNGSFGGMTEHRPGENNPWWSAQFNFPSCTVGNTLKLEVWDKDLMYDDHKFTCTRTLQSGTYDVTCSTSQGALLYRYKAS